MFYQQLTQLNLKVIFKYSLLILKIKTEQTAIRIIILAMALLTNRDQSFKINLPANQNDKFTIGRTPQNSLQILDSTVSKVHALIYCFGNQQKYVLQDVGSINGTFINSQQILKSKIYLQHHDQIQFGKNSQIYIFHVHNPEPQKKGKINFKDYHFELQEEFKPKPLIETKKLSEPNSLKFQEKLKSFQNKLPKTVDDKSHQNKNKFKFQRAIKIPKFQQFLQIQGVQLQQQPQSFKSNQMKQNFKIQSFPMKQQKMSNKKDQKNLKLPELNDNQLSDQDKFNKIIIERKRQLQKAQKQALLKKAQEQQKMIQQRLRLQLQKAEHEDELLRQKYQIQKKAEMDEKNLKRQKALLEEKIKAQQKQVRQRQQLRALQFQQKQEALLAELKKAKQLQMLKLKQKEKQINRQFQQQKQKQLIQIKETQAKKRTQKQEQIKRQIQQKKNQLQLEAQALTKQYQKIYRDTIKKLKLNLEAHQAKVSEIQTEIQKLEKENGNLDSCIQLESQALNVHIEEFSDINGRNQAFLLYASQLQTKIDNLKAEIDKEKIKDPSKAALEIKQSLIQSRKLLNMKLNQHSEIQNSIRQSLMNLNISSPQSQQYLSTILLNYQQIQRLKDLHFEFSQEQKIIQNKWDLDLQQNNVLEQKLRNSQKEIDKNKRKISENLNDNLKKLTEQRLHMLKMMYYIPEDKKSAAKYLIEEMLNIQQQNKAITLDSEEVHSKITELIIAIQQKKRQNEELSTIIFGNDPTSHHFDNMKREINRLISCIENQRDDHKATNFVKMAQQLKELQNKLYLESKRLKKLKDQIKNIGYAISPLNIDKNPLVFFGKLMAKKQAQLAIQEEKEKASEKKLKEMRTVVEGLINKKRNISKLLEDYKQRQLQNIRNLLK